MFLYHLSELKLRLTYTIFTYFLTLLISYFHCEELLIYLSSSLISLNIINYFIYTGITEAFTSYLILTIFSSFVICIPNLLLQIWLYIIPGLYNYERRSLKYKLILIVFMILIGIERSIHLLIPFTYLFFINFNQNIVTLIPKLNEYVNFVLNSIITLTLVLSIPMIIYITNIKSSVLIFLRKYMIILILIVGGIITPPNIISQLLICIPFIIIYEFLIYIKLYKEMR